MPDPEDLNVSVATPEAATRLQSDFDELLARVNGDLMFHSMQPADPISVEAVIAFAERSIEQHLRTFEADPALQSLAPEIKQRFRQEIERQAESTRTK